MSERGDRKHLAKKHASICYCESSFQFKTSKRLTSVRLHLVLVKAEVYSTGSDNMLEFRTVFNHEHDTTNNSSAYSKSESCSLCRIINQQTNFYGIPPARSELRRL
ncbi:hypothetical protein RB195_013894 [Necator americanus]|uniref:FLYWCH-type domain-containing protein n=1 Tax=Necator americanus TaxID=51031 RepID=A0ABR1DXM9_NECAM